nr:putative capsid [Marmot picobirnavirus]
MGKTKPNKIKVKDKDKANDKLDRNSKFNKQRMDDIREEGKQKGVKADLNPKLNDASSYTPTPQLVKDVCNISMYTRTGVNLDMGIPWVNPVTHAQSGIIPGIMNLYFIPTFGVSSDYSDPFNVNAQAIYAYVRKANSGRINYDPSDLMCYLGAISSALLYHAILCGIIGKSMKYDASNAYYPEGLVDGYGVDFWDVRKNMPTLRSYVNQFALKINNYFFPDVFPFLKEQLKMVLNCYKDGDSGKAQVYQFIPTHFYMYDEKSSEQGSSLSAVKFVSNTDVMNTLKRRKVDDLIQFGDQLLNALTQSSDTGIYDGDLRKAYETNRYIASEIGEQFIIEPTKSDEILMKINNLTIWPDVDLLGTSLDFTPNINRQTLTQVIQYPSFEFGEEFSASEVLKLINSNKIVNFYWDNVTPDDVLVATRWMTFGAFDTHVATAREGETLIQLDNYGFEIFTGSNIAYRRQPGVSNLNGFAYRKLTTTMQGSEFAENLITASIAALEKFSSHPFFYKYLCTNEDGTYVNPELFDIIGDFDNYAVVSKSTVQNIHLVATEGGLGLPQSI